MAAHAKLSASGAHRWLGVYTPPAGADDRAWLDPDNWQGCPASVSVEAGIADKGSSYASEGTAAHFIVERCLTERRDADAFIGDTVRVHATRGALGFVDETFGHPGGDETDFEIDDGMAGYCQQYVDAVRERGGDQDFEVRVDYSDYVPGGFGTSDANSYVDETRTLFVDDFKYGQGVRVDAEFNPQGLLYAVGSYLDNELINDVEFVVIAIHQPRMDHVSEWRVLAADLIEWAANVARPAALRALSAAAEFGPSEKTCQFCKAKPTCRARAAWIAEVAASGFDAVPVPASADVSIVARGTSPIMGGDELATIWPRVKLLAKWAAEISDYVKAEFDAGRPVPGFKLVAGNGSREWLDAEKAEAALKRKVGADKAVRREVISVAQAEKLVGKTDRLMSDKYVLRKDGKPAVALADDPRPSIAETAVAGFEAVGDLDVSN